MKPVVAVIGRPNAGKSTFFNRVTRSRNALVDNFPGVTRDRIFGDAVWNDVSFTLVDTGGFSTAEDDPFAENIRRQIEQAVDEADAVVMLLDGKGGVSPFDMDLIHMVRPLEKPVLYAVNKIDAATREEQLYEFYRTGVPELMPISAEHGYGMNDFLDALVRMLPISAPEAESDIIRVAVVGRPNAGKSSLINRMIGADRHVVSDLPGTTRDAVDSLITVGDKSYRIVDTAGIRRKGKVRRKLEKFSIIKALRSLEKCDVALIVLDAGEGITDQDISIAGYAHDRGCGSILLLNKWDLIKKAGNTVKEYTAELRYRAKFLGFAPVLTLSALTGMRVNRIFGLVDTVYGQYTTRIGTGPLNRIISEAVARNEPPLHRGRRLKFYYATQISAGPPTFICFVNAPDAVHFSYQRYLVNQIREGTGLVNTPIRLFLRQRVSRSAGRPKKKR